MKAAAWNSRTRQGGTLQGFQCFSIQWTGTLETQKHRKKVTKWQKEEKSFVAIFLYSIRYFLPKGPGYLSMSARDWTKFSLLHKFIILLCQLLTHSGRNRRREDVLGTLDVHKLRQRCLLDKNNIMFVTDCVCDVEENTNLSLQKLLCNDQQTLQPWIKSDKADNSEPKLLFEQNHVSRGCHPLVVVKDFYKSLMTPFLRPNAQLKGTGHHQNQKYIFLLLSI